MTDLLSSPDPRTGAELRTALAEVHRKSVGYWESFDTAAFLAPIGDAWSPAENVRHLTKSMRAVTQGLHMPSPVLWILSAQAFLVRGPQGPSRPYAEVREAYQARLAKGADAGRFSPGKRPVPSDPAAERARVMTFHATALSALDAAIARWSERRLDVWTLPHPLMGPLTVREMLCFTVYHNQHHVENVRRRVGAAPAR